MKYRVVGMVHPPFDTFGYYETIEINTYEEAKEFALDAYTEEAYVDRYDVFVSSSKKIDDYWIIEIENVWDDNYKPALVIVAPVTYTYDECESILFHQLV